MVAETFTRSGGAPDLVALANAIRAIVGDPFYLSTQTVNGAQQVIVTKPAAWTSAEITAVQSAVTAAADDTPELDAQYQIDNWPISQKAFALALIDELNSMNANIAQLNAVAKTTLPFSTATITPAMAIAAIRIKAGTL